jgi:hypothetical protein
MAKPAVALRVQRRVRPQHAVLFLERCDTRLNYRHVIEANVESLGDGRLNGCKKQREAVR